MGFWDAFKEKPKKRKRRKATSRKEVIYHYCTKCKRNHPSNGKLWRSHSRYMLSHSAPKGYVDRGSPNL
jgi:hypothetical protein